MNVIVAMLTSFIKACFPAPTWLLHIWYIRQITFFSLKKSKYQNSSALQRGLDKEHLYIDTHVQVSTNSVKFF